MPENHLERFLREPLTRLTASTIIKPNELRAAIDSSRRTGIAFDDEEHTEGICAVGTAFLDPLGRSIALSIPIPTPRFKRMKNTLVKELLNARASIIEALGPNTRP
jgi:DNA-binding IclR family transcriptional regulator